MEIGFYESGHQVIQFFQNQTVNLPVELFNSMLAVLSNACGYEEEGQKIKPSLLIGHQLVSPAFKSLTQATIISCTTEEIATTNLAKRLKSLLPFCVNGWRVLVDCSCTHITYGLLRVFNGPSGLDLHKILGEHNTSRDKMPISFIMLDTVNSSEILLSGLTDSCKIDFKLIKAAVDLKEIDNPQLTFVADFLSGYDVVDDKIVRAYQKIVQQFLVKLHGSICLLVKNDIELPDPILKDGIFFENPIDICSILSNELRDIGTNADVISIITSHEKYHAFAGLLYEMLNIDGITVVDDLGRLRGYNVFVKPTNSNNNSVAGGARRRASEYLVSINNPNYIGVYFQSQDGNMFYKKVVHV